MGSMNGMACIKEIKDGFYAPSFIRLRCERGVVTFNYEGKSQRYLLHRMIRIRLLQLMYQFSDYLSSTNIVLLLYYALLTNF